MDHVNRKDVMINFVKLLQSVASTLENSSADQLLARQMLHQVTIEDQPEQYRRSQPEQPKQRRKKQAAVVDLVQKRDAP